MVFNGLWENFQLNLRPKHWILIFCETNLVKQIDLTDNNKPRSNIFLNISLFTSCLIQTKKIKA